MINVYFIKKEDDQKELDRLLQEKFSCIPVFLEDQLAEDYYNGFSNGVLWPLFHYLTSESGENFTGIF
jgi:trehalose-6-phosphate synthase